MGTYTDRTTRTYYANGYSAPARSIGTTYTAGASPRLVMATFVSTLASQVEVGMAASGTPARIATLDLAANARTPVTFMVPPTFVYRIRQSSGTTTVSDWYEADL